MDRKKILRGIIFLILALFLVLLFTGNLTLPSLMEIYGCQEMFSQYYVDPEIAREDVPEKWNPKIYENGQALLLAMVQECDKMVLDKIFDLGEVGMSHLWIEVDGPNEILEPYQDTSRSLPTRYWFILPHQLDKLNAHRLFRIAGVDSQEVAKISLGGDPMGTRSGLVKESNTPEKGYNWTESSDLYPQPDIVTGSQKFYRQYRNREFAAQAKCISHFLGDSDVTITAEEESTVGQLGFGTTLEGWANPVWVEYCRVDYQVRFFPGEN